MERNSLSRFNACSVISPYGATVSSSTSHTNVCVFKSSIRCRFLFFLSIDKKKDFCILCTKFEVKGEQIFFRNIPS